MSPPALLLRGLHKRYRRGLFGRPDSTAALDEVDLVVERGEVLGLAGESGSGKTTLARVALGLVRPDRGEVEVLGQPILALRGAALDRLRRRVQPVFQEAEAHLDPGLRVEQILRQTLSIHRPDEAPAPLLAEVLERVGLTHRAGATVDQLSGGERRRVGVARVLLCRPELVIADEPTSGLDAARKHEILRLLLHSEVPGRATLLISHDLPLLAGVAHRLAVMLGGRIVELLPIERLGHGPHHPFTHALLLASGAAIAPVVSASPPHLAAPPPRAANAACPWLGACSVARPICATDRPPLVERSAGHRVACHALAEPQPPASGLSR